MNRMRLSQTRASRNTRNHKNVRHAMYAKIKITWRQLRPDLQHSAKELREGLLDFAQAELKLNEPLDSLKHLSDAKLGQLIEALARDQRQPSLTGCEKHHIRAPQPGIIRCGPKDMVPSQNGAEVHHLASAEQVWAIERVFEYRRWSKEFQESWLQSKYRRKSPQMLTPKQANSALYILLRMTAHKAIKARAEKKGLTIKKISPADLAIEMNQLKRRLGIDQVKEV